DQVGEAFVAFALEMVLGGPQAVVAELVHGLCDIPCGPERLAQAVARITAVLCRCALDPDIVELDLADIEGVKPFDHVATNPPFTNCRSTLVRPAQDRGGDFVRLVQCRKMPGTGDRGDLRSSLDSRSEAVGVTAGDDGVLLAPD